MALSRIMRFESRTIRHAVETQPLIDMAHANGNLTIYCHPEWSGTPKSDFDMLYGNFAMEIWNSGCAMEETLSGHERGLDRGRDAI